MASNNPTPNPNPEAFDWTAAEADVADVVDLNSERTRRAGSSDTHFEVALDEVPQRGGMPVDPPAHPSGRRPIVAPNWSTWRNIRHSLAQLAELTAYRIGFHAIRTPWY